MDKIGILVPDAFFTLCSLLLCVGPPLILLGVAVAYVRRKSASPGLDGDE